MFVLKEINGIYNYVKQMYVSDHVTIDHRFDLIFYIYHILSRLMLLISLCYSGIISYYRNIAKPLTLMLKKEAFTWTPDAEEAFSKLKLAMTRAPVLALPDFAQPFAVESDASGAGVGAVLMQKHSSIAFFSHALKGRNLALSTHDKEMLAILLAIKKWHPYLVGRTFVIRTNQRSLKYLWDQRIATDAQQK